MSVKESQREPKRAKESQRGPKRFRERQREAKRAQESRRESKRVKESQREAKKVMLTTTVGGHFSSHFGLADEMPGWHPGGIGPEPICQAE